MNPEQDSAQTPAATPTPDNLTVAREALAGFHHFTSEVTRRLDQQLVMPQVEAGWRRQQDAQLELARTSALVSLAESVAALAGVATRAEAAFVETLAGGDLAQEFRDEVTALRTREAERHR